MSRPVVSVFLGQAKVDQEQLVAVSPDPHEEVVWLNVSVDEVFIMNIPSKDSLVKLNELMGRNLTRFCQSSDRRA